MQMQSQDFRADDDDYSDTCCNDYRRKQPARVGSKLRKPHRVLPQPIQAPSLTLYAVRHQKHRNSIASETR